VDHLFFQFAAIGIVKVQNFVIGTKVYLCGQLHMVVSIHIRRTFAKIRIP